MRYPDAAELTQAQVEAAFLHVTRAQTLEALTDSLSQREFWRRYLRQQHGRMFDAISADNTQRIIRLQAQQPALSPTALEEQLSRLREQQSVDTERLISELTQSYLRAAKRAAG